jgi:repressor LexA
MQEPTDRQALALRLIDEHVRLVGCPPTLRELGELMTIRSNNGVNDHLEALESKGYIERRDRLARAILITDKGREYLASKATT